MQGRKARVQPGLLLLKLLFQPMVFLTRNISSFPVRIQGQLHLLDALTLGFKLCPLGLQMVCGTAARAAAVDLGNQLIHLDRQSDLAAERLEHSLLQTVAADSMLCAGAAVLLLKRRADIVVIVAMRLGNQLSVHCLAAVRAAEKTGEQVDLLVRWRGACIALEKRLRLVEQLAWDDGLMRLLDSDPVLLGHGLADMQFVAFCAVFALDHRAGVQRIAQNAAYRAVRPQTVQFIRCGVTVVHALLPLVGGRVRDTHGVQFLCNAEHTRAADEPVENIAHDRGGRLVDQQTAVVIRVFAVAVGRERADEFALAALQVKRSADLVRDVSGVFVI